MVSLFSPLVLLPDVLFWWNEDFQNVQTEWQNFKKVSEHCTKCYQYYVRSNWDNTAV